MDIKEKIEEILGKLQGNKALTKDFKKNPIDTVKGLLGGIDLPEDQIKGIVEAIKAKLGGGGFLDKIKNLFKKK